jgi:hypothetical protein
MSPFRLVFILVFLSTSSGGFAEDSLESVLLRLKPKQAMAIRYHEKRSMGFFSEDKHSEGILYVTPNAILLKVQHQPTLEYMGLEKNQLYYYNPLEHQRYQIEMNDDLPMSGALKVLKRLMAGDITALKRLYGVQFSVTAKQWRIQLTQRDYQTEENLPPIKVMLQGDKDQAADTLMMTESDGDRSHFQLSFENQGKVVEKRIQEVLERLKKSR